MKLQVNRRNLEFKTQGNTLEDFFTLQLISNYCEDCMFSANDFRDNFRRYFKLLLIFIVHTHISNEEVSHTKPWGYNWHQYQRFLSD